MRNFRFYVETEPGLLVRRSETEHIVEELGRLAPELQGHYRRVWARPEAKAVRERRQYEHVLAMGGGLPAFEIVGLRAKRISVLDLTAEVYESSLDAFAAYHPEAPPVAFIGGDLRTDADFAGVDAVSYCHVLEHVALDEAAESLAAAAESAADIYIYGPNADTAAADTWWHFLPVHEHIWLAGLKWTRAWAEKATGRSADIAFAHDMDLFLRLPAPEKPAEKPAKNPGGKARRAKSAKKATASKRGGAE